MRTFWYSVLAVLVLVIGSGYATAADDEPQADFRAKFQVVLDGINENSLDAFNAAIWVHV
jgi:hypothetical protein